MKKFYVLLSILASVNLTFAQTKVSIENLPIQVSQSIKSELGTLATTRKAAGEISYTQGEFEYKYEYTLIKRRNKIIGVISFVQDCQDCPTMLNTPIKTSLEATTFRYCCKDKDHIPNETATSLRRMERIKEENNCSAIGLCIGSN